MIREKNILYIWQGRVLYGASQGYSTEPHGHYAASVLIGLDEPLTLNVAGETSFPRCVVLGPNLLHQSISKSRVIVLQLDPDSELYEPISRWPGDAGYLEIPYERVAHFAHRWSEFFLDALDCGAADRLYRELLQTLGGDPPRTPRAPARDERIVRLLEELKADLPDQVSVADLAARVGLSEDRFMHVFKSAMGLPVRRYLLWLRLHRAARLMKDGITLTEAAHGAGFADSAHMSRTFKDNFGVPPSFFLGPPRKDLELKLYFCTGE